MPPTFLMIWICSKSIEPYPSTQRREQVFNESPYLQSEDGIDGKVGEILLVLRQDFGREGGTSNVEEVLTELLRI